MRARVGVTESHKEPEREWERSSKPHIFNIPKHCFVAKQLNKTLFCMYVLGNVETRAKVQHFIFMNNFHYVEVAWPI